MAWNVWSCNTRTGVKEILLAGNVMQTFSWERTLNEGGAGTGSIPLKDELVRQLDIKSYTQPVARTLVLEWVDAFTPSGKVVYAGLIWDRKYNKDTGTLTIQHADVWSLWKKRLLAATNTAGIEATSLNFGGRTLEAIARSVVFHGTNDGADYTLPLFVGDGAAAGSDARIYYGYHVPIVAEALEELMDAPGGPDIDFDPEWTPGAFGFRWNLRAGALGGGPWDFHPDTDQSGMSGITLDEDANKMATNVLALGEGTEKNMLVRSATLNPAGLPALDVPVAYKDETDGTRLQSRASSEHTGRNVPTTQWGADILASPPVDAAGVKIGAGVADLALGGTVRLFSDGDPWIEDGWHANRLIGFSGDLGESVTLQFQPSGG